MKSYQRIILLTLFPGYFFQHDVESQNINGDSIYVDVTSVVTVFFPSSPSKAELINTKGLEGLYKADIMGKKSIFILALKPTAQTQDLEVTEGDRKHVFVIAYKDGSPARSIDLSSKRKLSDRSNQAKKALAKELEEANMLFTQGQNSRSDQALWEKIETKYSGLLRFLDPKEREIAQSRLDESHKQLELIGKGKKFDEAMKEGQNYFHLKNYGEAREAYLNALNYKPADQHALKNIRLTDSVLCKEYIDYGDAEIKAKNYVLAKTNYQNALSIKADYPFLQEKYDQVKKQADPIIYEIEKKKGNKSMKAKDLYRARQAYDSARSVKPGDGYIMAQLKKLGVEEEKVLEEEKKEAAYQEILANAKNLADKAAAIQEFDLAIREYERALGMVPTRKFPKKKIKQLTKIKNTLR